MFADTSRLNTRATRYVPRPEKPLQVMVGEGSGYLENISRSGLACIYSGSAATLRPGSVLRSLRLTFGKVIVDCGPVRIARTAKLSSEVSGGAHIVGFAFDQEQPELIGQLEGALKPYDYVTGELSGRMPPPSGAEGPELTLDQFHSLDSPDLFAKCKNFKSWIGEMQDKQIYQKLYRVTLTGAIDNRVTVVDPISGTERVMHCFDSNSYLGLHRHPRVIEEVTRVTKLVGYGTPSAQLLCGTNRYLRELEQALAEFHGREDAIVFPTGFAANIGTLHALLRDGDAVIRDQFAHASIHEGCRTSNARMKKIFGHNKPDSLDRVLKNASNAGCSGKLVVTDGVFSMHGQLAPLPELVSVCREHNARLMVDDAHGVGVVGKNGRGVEEHFGMVGSVDVLMGTLSKALGCVGGYVCGDTDLVNYLRWFAPSGLFTTALPAAACAGIKTALELIGSEPEHREHLWKNINQFVPALKSAGFIVSEPTSPIVTVFVGAQSRLWEVSRELFEAGIKCGNVIYPAVAKTDTILRFTINARHTSSDLEYVIDTLTRIGRQHGLLGRTREELRSTEPSAAQAA
jgi:8-amino-7-oxononanoate synthase